MSSVKAPAKNAEVLFVTDPWAPAQWPPAQPWNAAPPQWNPAPPQAGPQTYWSPVPPKRKRTGLIVGICVGVVVLVMGVVGVGAFLVSARLDAAGTPGYSTFSGPAGKPLPVGRPWGRACQPIVLAADQDVPAGAYAQIVAVVNEARAGGLDVTVEDRSFNWHPDSLYYPPGTTSANVQEVDISINLDAPTRLKNGQPGHVSLGWEASRDPDGKHEVMTGAQGTLQMVTLTGDAIGQRSAARFIVALGEGIAGSDRSDSGLKAGAARDSFSAKDIAAMKKMSGCGDAPDSVVEHIPT